MYISSIDRQNGEEINNFAITFPQTFLNVQHTEIIRMFLVGFSCTNYFYTTNYYNNEFQVSFDGGATWNTHHLPIGNYTTSQNLTNFSTIIGTAYPGTYVVWTALAGSKTGQYSYIVETGNPFLLRFPESASPTQFANYGASALLGFNLGGANATTGETTPYIISFNSTSQVAPAPPVEGYLPYINLKISTPPQNVSFNNLTGYLDYTTTFANIPIGNAPFGEPINYLPQDTNTWSWQSPAKGVKIGRVSFQLQDPAGNPLAMMGDYSMSIRMDVYIDDVVEQLKLLRESLKMQKIMFLHGDHSTKKLIRSLRTRSREPEPVSDPDEPVSDPDEEEAEPGEPEPDETAPIGGVQMSEDQLHEGTVDYYGDPLF